MKHLSLAIIGTAFIVSSAFSSTLSSEIKENSLVVYNGNLGLVHEERALTLNRDDKSIVYDDVASSFNTDSVNVKLPDSVKLYSQQYRFDKLTQQKLLDAHIGKVVQVKKENCEAKDGSPIYKKSVTLLSNEGNNVIVKDANNLISLVKHKNIIFNTIPDSLITKPSLVWNIDAKKNLKTQMGIDYLIKNLSWKSDYILNLKGNEADLSGWITIDNRSGKSYKNTNLYVLAGDINRVTQPRIERRYVKAKAMMQDAPTVSHKAHEGYHFYSIPFKVNLANNEKTQIKFISKNAIPIERRYIARATNPLYLHSEIKHNVTQYIAIKKLPFPLPKGVVRTYSKLNSQNILLGESSLSHTPKETPIKLTLGKNFDLKVKESIQKRSDNKRYLDASVLYTLKNSSNEKKIIELLVPFNKNTTSTIETSKAYKFKNGNQLSFKISLNAKKTLTFLVRFRSKR